MNIRKRAVWGTSRGAPAGGSERADIVIVGNGIAGLTAAIEARRLAPEKRVTIVSEQCHPTIHTPALKQFATGKLTQEQLLAYPSGTERLQSIRVKNARVEEIKSKGNFIRLSDGYELGYESLLLATGSTPTGLPADVAGRDFDGVMTLHRLGDYLDLRRRLRLHEVKEAVVIGGGTHAVETVMVLLHWGVRVQWLMRGSTFLSRVLDHAASDIVLERIRAAGASVHTGTEIVGIVGKVGAVAGVVTNTGEVLACQVVLACTGTTPVTTLAEHCDHPLKHNHGILVDDRLHTSAQHIYAAGDVAALQNPQTGIYQTRPHWQTAVLQGRMAAAIMTGHNELALPLGTPWHATHLGTLSLLAVGDPLRDFEGATTITDNRKGNYRRISICGDRLVSYLSLGAVQPDSLAIKRIIDEERPVRKIEQALLTGELDMRHYVALSDAHTAQRIAVTGELPAVRLSKPTIDLSQELPNQQNTEPLPRLAAAPVHRERNTSEDEDVFAPQTNRPLEGSAPVIGSVKALMNKQRRPTRWIVPGIIPQGLVALVGRQKVGKSWFDLSLGVSVANGGAGASNINAEKGGVLYLALEDNEQRLQERLNALQARGVDLSDDFEYATSWPKMDAGGIDALESWLFTHPQARLVMIDTWTKVLAAPSQQVVDSEEASDAQSLAALKSLADFYSVCIMIQFHTPKSTAGTPFNALKARTSIAEYADGVLHLKRAHHASSASLSLYKSASTRAVHLALSFNDGLWRVADDAPIQQLTGSHRAIVEMLNRSRKPAQERGANHARVERTGTYDLKSGYQHKNTDEAPISLFYHQDHLPERIEAIESEDSSEEAPLLVLNRLY